VRTTRWSASLVGAIALALLLPTPAHAQTAQQSMKSACADATRAFTLRNTAMEAEAVADPAEAKELRQAALLFYRCSQREQDPYLHALFAAYYANTLYKVGIDTNDTRAQALAARAADPLRSSDDDDVRDLVSSIRAPSSGGTVASAPAPAATPVPRHSAAYCAQFSASVQLVLQNLLSAVPLAINAGQNDTQYLANTTARYGSAFKYVEDDYANAQSYLDEARSHISDADGQTASLNDAEQPKANANVEALRNALQYTDTYLRLALTYERGVNGANRRLAAARVSQSLANMSQNSSYTYTNGTANCYSFTDYSANCYVNSSSNTTYNNSAAIAQQNAANALALAQAGRLSLGQANETLTEGLSSLSSLQDALNSAQTSWTKACSGN